MKEIYILPIKEAELIPEQYCMDSFPGRMERAAAFRQKEDRLRCIGAGALLCYAGIREEEIIYNEYGKPLCEGKNFSVTHGGDYVAVAVADGVVGVDIENAARRYADIAKRVLTEEEFAWADSDERFFVLWTLKESIMKAEGKGFAMNPGSFSVLPIVGGRSVDIGGREYFGESITLDGHVLSSVSGRDDKAKYTHITKEML